MCLGVLISLIQSRHPTKCHLSNLAILISVRSFWTIWKRFFGARISLRYRLKHIQVESLCSKLFTRDVALQWVSFIIIILYIVVLSSKWGTVYHSRLGGIIVSSRKCPEKPTLLYRFASFVSRATHSSTIMRKWISLYTTTSNCHRFLKYRLSTVTSVFSATRLPVSGSYEDTDFLSKVRWARGIKANNSGGHLPFAAPI